MGRFDKAILIATGMDRREEGYYSTPEFIADFLFNVSVKVHPTGKWVLDPCVGNEELIARFSNAGKQCDGYDINAFKAEYEYCNFTQRDYLDVYTDFKVGGLYQLFDASKYDYFVANPPYNCHEVNFIKNNKASLKSLFPKVGVHNMYSMFLSAMIDMASEGAVLSIIVSDSFLTSSAHKQLREQILETCSIHYLLLCPSDLFRDQKADVRTCIIVLQKGIKFQRLVKTLDRPKNKKQLEKQLSESSFEEVGLQSIVIYPDTSKELAIGVDEEVQKLLSFPKLGDIFNCITGISTGNDKLYLSKKPKEGFTTPFYKNPGSKKFHCEPNCYLVDSYLELDRKIKDFMVRNKRFLLMPGITCSSMGVTFSACYLPKGSTYGVNPNIIASEDDIWWLLSYLNSSLVTYLVRGVLCRSNMITSGYVSRIPLIDLSKKAKLQLSAISRNAYLNKVASKELKAVLSEIDHLIFTELELPDRVRLNVINFSENLQLRV